MDGADTGPGRLRVNPYFFFLVAAAAVTAAMAFYLGRRSPIAAVLLALFFVSLARQAWQVRPKRPLPGVLYEGITKAAIHDGPIERGWHWVASRRGVLTVTTNELRCGDWTIPHSSIDDAKLVSWRSWLGIPGVVLLVRSGDRTYQFGLLGNRFWSSELPFPVERTQGRVGYSTFSIVLRIALLAAAAWLLWRAIQGQH